LKVSPILIIGLALLAFAVLMPYALSFEAFPFETAPRTYTKTFLVKAEVFERPTQTFYEVSAHVKINWAYHPEIIAEGDTPLTVTLQKDTNLFIIHMVATYKGVTHGGSVIVQDGQTYTFVFLGDGGATAVTVVTETGTPTSSMTTYATTYVSTMTTAGTATVATITGTVTSRITTPFLGQDTKNLTLLWLADNMTFIQIGTALVGAALTYKGFKQSSF